MDFYYQAFGLRIRSNVPIPDLVPVLAGGPAELTVHMGVWPPWLSDLAVPAVSLVVTETSADKDYRKHYRVAAPDGQLYQLYAFPDGCQFLVNAKGTEIWARWPSKYAIEELFPYLLGPVLGLAAFLRGSLSLHASAFFDGTAAVLFLGPGGAGKSTALAGMVQRGFKSITEDLSLIDVQESELIIQPGYPRIRLWPEGVGTVLGAGAEAPRLTPTWDKRYLSVTDRFHMAALRIGRIYFLQPRTNEPDLQPIRLLSQSEAFMRLLANVYYPIPHDAPKVAKHLYSLKRLAGSGMVRSVTASNHPHTLGKFLDLIQSDCLGPVPTAPRHV